MVESVVISLSGGIGLLVASLESVRYWQQWQHQRPTDLYWNSVLLGLIVSALVAVGLAVTVDPAPWLWSWLLVGSLLGALSVVLSPLGRAAQGIALVGACLAAIGVLPHDATNLIQLAAMGLGLGLVGIPTLLLMPLQTGINLLQSLTQSWLLIAGMSWGIRLAALSDSVLAEWLKIVPLGLGALALVAGTVPILVEPSTPTNTQSTLASSKPLAISSRVATSASALWGRGIGCLVSGILAWVLVRNWLTQSQFYAQLFTVGLILSLIILWVDSQLTTWHPEQPQASRSQLLWRGCVSLMLVGGGSLLALRLGGSYGSALMGLGLLAFPCRWGATAALFLASRPLVQSLLYEFDLNLSGINITHTYTYAALYLGSAVVIVALLIAWIYIAKAPMLTSGSLTLGSIAISGMTGYFLHLEPQAAFLLGSMMVALVIAALDPVIQTLSVDAIPLWSGSQGLMLILVATLTAIVSTDLTLAGSQATRVERLIVLGVIALGLGSVLLGAWIWSHWRDSRSP